jgi:molybdopterin synthase catalytic subunit
MDITVRFFATYREAAGLRETKVVLEPDATVQDLVDRLVEAHPKLRSHRASMLVAVNEEFADESARLKAGDDVALLPPVSGGDGRRCWVQAEAIDAEALVDLVKDPMAGAVVLFLGTVRADPGVKALEYEAYDSMAVKKMEALCAAAKEKFGVTELAIVHRTGRLPPGETSVAVACSAPHRQAAFDACSWAMDELKQVVPIWKMERE